MVEQRPGIALLFRDRDAVTVFGEMLGPIGLRTLVPIGLPGSLRPRAPFKCLAVANVLLVGLVLVAWAPAHAELLPVIDKRRTPQEHRQRRGGAQLLRRHTRI